MGLNKHITMKYLSCCFMQLLYLFRAAMSRKESNLTKNVNTMGVERILRNFLEGVGGWASRQSGWFSVSVSESESNKYSGKELVIRLSWYRLSTRKHFKLPGFSVLDAIQFSIFNNKKKKNPKSPSRKSSRKSLVIQVTSQVQVTVLSSHKSSQVIKASSRKSSHKSQKSGQVASQVKSPSRKSTSLNSTQECKQSPENHSGYISTDGRITEGIP